MSGEPPTPAETLSTTDVDAEPHTDAEGAPDVERSGSESTLREMMLATDPEQPLDQVEAPYDPDAGGIKRIYRGIQKAIDIDGMPAVVDVAIGAVEAVQNMQFEGGTGDDQGDEPEQDGIGELGAME